MHWLGYIAFRFAVLLCAIMPFAVLYKLSNGMAWIINHVFKYRKRVVYNNISQAFPELSARELRQIIAQTYINFTDIFLESLKGFSMSPAAISKRYHFNNTQLLEEYFKTGQSLIGVAGHLANWEWAARCIDRSLSHQVVGIVKPINNPLIQKYVKQNRGGEKVITEFVKSTRTAFEKHKEKTSIYILIADQSPVNMKTAVWVDFMGRKTPFLHGPATFAKKYNYPIVYMPIKRLARGKYAVDLSIMTSDPIAHSLADITQQFASQMESAIRSHPEQWLWTHRRWKRAHLYTENTDNS